MRMERLPATNTHTHIPRCPRSASSECQDTSQPRVSAHRPCRWLEGTKWDKESEVTGTTQSSQWDLNPWSSELYRICYSLCAHTYLPFVPSMGSVFSLRPVSSHPLPLSLCLYCSSTRNNFPLLPILQVISIVQRVGDGEDT